MLGVELKNDKITNKLMENLIDHGLISDRFLFMPRILPTWKNITQKKSSGFPCVTI